LLLGRNNWRIDGERAAMAAVDRWKLAAMYWPSSATADACVPSVTDSVPLLTASEVLAPNVTAEKSTATGTPNPERVSP
jgi:hypothetical protein